MDRWLLHSLDMFRLMAPYLLLGFTLAGILHVLVARAWVARHLGGRGLSASIKAALVGTPLPLCSCGVIPFADLLKRQGASRSAVTSFLISTPQTGVDSILASYAMLGLPLALWKVVTAIVSGVLGGTLVGWLVPEAPAAGERGRIAADGAGTGAVEPSSRTLGARARRAAAYGYGMLIEEIAIWLILGTLIGGAIAAFVPPDFLAQRFPDPRLQMLSVLIVAVPLYVCATGSVPVAMALVMKGLPLGAALVFLIAGPATNVATLSVFTRVLGRRTAAIYLGTIIVVSVLSGLLFEALFPGARLPLMAHGHAGHLAASPLADVAWWEWASAVALGLMLARALLVKARLRGAARTRSGPAMAGGGGAMESIELAVEGMSCDHCRGSVQRALEAVAGVAEVSVSLEEGRARVRGPHLELPALVTAVQAAGFRVVDGSR